MAVLLDAAKLARTLDRLAEEIAAALPGDAPAAVVGIRSRGEVLARRLIRMLEARGRRGAHHGCLDITLYRDDLAEIGPAAVVRSTEIDFDVSGVLIVLVDDVLYTGRSVRAAIDALVDLGRPRAIRLAVLVDRGGRELPIQADYVGERVRTSGSEVIRVRFEAVDGEDSVQILQLPSPPGE
jgi:pyrimidine operon attenuation protein/uracil phosphoribosyltransferase